MTLFKSGRFTGSAGSELSWKIECDALSDEDVETIAQVIAQNYPLSAVHSVPRGGDRLAMALEKHLVSFGKVAIVDDVLTTGGSMERKRSEIGDCIGFVIFARGPCPDWVHPIFTLADWARQ